MTKVHKVLPKRALKCRFGPETELTAPRRIKILMKKQKGFSLIELLIVVAIILIIAAIAIPNLLRARMAANESSAAAGVRTINTAQYSYQAKFPAIGYAANLTALGTPAGAGCVPDPAGVAGDCQIDNVLTLGMKGGYTYTTTVTGAAPATGYTVAAAPTTPNQTGSKWFCSYADAVVRGRTTAVTAAACNGTIPQI